MERRTYKRVKKEIKILIKEKHDDAMYVLGQGKVRDISATGVLFDYESIFDVNTVINLRFLEPGTFAFFESDARIVRIEINPDDLTYSIGVEFINITEEKIKNLDYFLFK